MQNYEKYYKKNISKIIAEIQKKWHFMPDNLVFIDSSAGDNKLVEKLLEEKLIFSYISYDISPPEKYFGKILKKDWLKINTTKNKNTIVGFNPPYGFGSKRAKEFIYKGFIENHLFCIWLVPISLKLFLLELYKPLLQKEFIQYLFDDIEGKKEIKQSVFLFIKRKNEESRRNLSLTVKKITSKYKYILKRTHNEGILKIALY